ncbi:MAG: type II toxin-antitoxin system HicB family antitoxin [Melioribacteraceae bacterium]|nr:type II toxin-antitoxin system HicB family antitoxin [Melioribacteraceae bacterium]MCF8353937.1 type II toxin-antitoxin system HicB family antitoxin [Melioribacteraceae bacterium]MCF8392694.1 type II toxin-antitoxin system HicB family antitoxin [Melioribacteraceae bacterium]MCF8417716.1 type II toxin-antitoxin system HicB family antitoxin [Melioribacteraceae bacterium]
MSNTQVVTLRLPKDLKRRLEREAKYQGVSINQLSNYLLNSQLTHLESISILESRLSKKSVSSLKRKVSQTLDKVPSRKVPGWDKVN